MYTIAVGSCSETGDLEFALSVYSDMKKNGVTPDEVFFELQCANNSYELQNFIAFLVCAVVKCHYLIYNRNVLEKANSSG